MVKSKSTRFGSPTRDPHEAIQLLDVSGKLAQSAEGLLTSEQIAAAMRLMLLSRGIDARVTNLKRLGQAGTYGPVHGQEAAVVGSAMALDPGRDWMVPATREHPAMVRHGLSLERLLAGFMGKINLSRIPEDVHLLPRNQSIAAQLPHAVGLAWALKLRHDPGVVLVYLGDGATSEGDFHEAANLAALQQVPLIFFLLNNQYAISTPLAMQTRARSLAAKAEGYGFPGVAVDGNDLFAVYAATTDAVNHALNGNGPTLIEARTYRIGFHNTSDNPKAYREESEVNAAAERDPIDRVRRYATRIGIWSRAMETEVLAAIRDEIDRSYQSAAAAPMPGLAEVFDHVYASPPLRIRRQREHMQGKP